MTDKVCLVVIFNHRFDKNLPLLRKIYGERFSEIRFLMPFYDGTDSDVIPVYESSWQFQGYLIQAYEKLKDIPCTHYLFIGDDLIIRPDFNEINFISQMNMNDKKFLSLPFTPLNSPNKFRWYWTAGSSKPFYDSSTSWRSSIYNYDEAMAKFNDFFGAKYKENYDEAFFGNPNEPGNTIFGGWNEARGFVSLANYFITTNGNTLHIPYPMACGGVCSDIFCIDKESLLEFSRLCGVFSAMNMFVEIATPTAAVLTFKREEVTFISKESALILWGNDRIVFESKLLYAGYLDLDEEYYKDRHYHIRKEQFFRVQDDFPRIKKDDLKIGVSEVKYSITLNFSSENMVIEGEVINTIVAYEGNK